MKRGSCGLAVLSVLFMTGMSTTALAQRSEPREEPPRPTGLTRNLEGAFQGYTLFTPMALTATYLLDMEGRVVHEWDTEFSGGANYLLPNGNLIYNAPPRGDHPLNTGGSGGRIQEYNWDGELVWDFTFMDDDQRQHHDIEPLPNGNILMISFDKRSPEEALAAGRHPPTIDRENGFWSEKIVEVKPTYPDGGEIVWEWHLWDHLVQDVDKEGRNYGRIDEYPHRVDINGERAKPLSDDEVERLRGLGYISGDSNERNERKRGDWCHMNGIDYNAELDQIAVSVPHFGEIWIIDHSTTTEEARGNTGGKRGKGGDLLFRYGNPQTYGRGTLEDQRLWYQHDVRWIPAGYPGEGNITLFNNGRRRPEAEGGEHSRFVELELPVDEGDYFLDDFVPFEPERPVWSYSCPDGDDRFYSSFISGGHRLPNGNSMICSGERGRLFEVTSAGEIVWEYFNPYLPKPPEDEGEGGQGRRGRGRVSVFRATRIAPDHPGLQGRELVPLDPQPPHHPPAEPRD